MSRFSEPFHRENPCPFPASDDRLTGTEKGELEDLVDAQAQDEFLFKAISNVQVNGSWTHHTQCMRDLSAFRTLYHPRCAHSPSVKYRYARQDLQTAVHIDLEADCDKLDLSDIGRVGTLPWLLHPSAISNPLILPTPADAAA